MITLEFVYVLMGLMVAGVAFINYGDRNNQKRVQNTLFWGIYAFTFLVGTYLPDFANGILVIIMVLVASLGKLGQSTRETSTHAERTESAARWGNKLFIPVLVVP